MLQIIQQVLVGAFLLGFDQIKIVAAYVLFKNNNAQSFYASGIVVLFKIPNSPNIVCVVLIVVVLVAIVEVLYPCVVVIVLAGTPIVRTSKTSNHVK